MNDPPSTRTSANDASRTDEATVTRSRYRTHDLDEAVEMLGSLYAAFKPSYFDNPGDDPVLQLGTDVVSSNSGPIEFVRLRHTVGGAAPVEPVTAPTFVVVGGGWALYRHGRHETATNLLMMPSWSSFYTAWQDLDAVTVGLDPDGVRRVAAEVTGTDPTTVTFTGINPVDSARARALASLVGHVRRDLLPDDEVLSSPLARAEIFRHLAIEALLTFPNTALAALDDPAHQDPGRAEPATVRRAVEFIDAHAGEPIGLADIAAAASLSPRGLQHAFARHRDISPLGYLRQVRLEHARRDLLAADSAAGDTVGAVAARWGFTHASHFTMAYRQRFGETPRTTLHR